MVSIKCGKIRIMMTAYLTLYAKPIPNVNDSYIYVVNALASYVEHLNSS